MPIDLRAAFDNEPPDLDCVWPGFLAGTVGALVAPGATGKSFLALQAAMAVACDVKGGDLLQLQPPRTGRVVYLAGEDPAPALIGRIHAIGRHLPQEAQVSISASLTLEAIHGKRLNIMNTSQQRRVIEACFGARLLVLDTLSRVHELDENSNSDMTRLVATLEQIAEATGAAVLYLHHVSKGSAAAGQLDQQQAARGASALIDNARWCGYVARMTRNEGQQYSDHISDKRPIGEDRRGWFVRFGASKQNYGVLQEDRWYERQSGGVLLPANLADVRSSAHARVQRQNQNRRAAAAEEVENVTF